MEKCNLKLTCKNTASIKRINDKTIVNNTIYKSVMRIDDEILFNLVFKMIILFYGIY